MALPHHVKQMAADAVSQCETMRQIRLVSASHIDAPLLTPKSDMRRVGGCAFMECLWRGNAVAATNDAQERDNGR